MGCATPFQDDLPFEEKVKCLADEELLEIWAESQQIEVMLASSLPRGCYATPNVEKVIVDELTARTGRRLARPGQRT